MLPLELLYLIRKQIHIRTELINIQEKSFGWMNLHLKYLENVVRQIFTDVQG